MMLVSCGAAVHHAIVALAADGWRTEVDRPAGRKRRCWPASG